MTRWQEGDGAVDECTSCHGVWLVWWGGEASGVAQTVPARPGSSPTGARGGQCPYDGTTLIDRAYLDSGPVVERCPTCLGLFARREQIAELAAFHERIPVDAPEPIVWVSFLSRFWHAFVE